MSAMHALALCSGVQQTYRLQHSRVSDALLQVVPTAMRGGLQSCGQNCAGAERFIVAAPLFDEFTARVVDTARKLRQVPQLVLCTARPNNMP